MNNNQPSNADLLSIIKAARLRLLELHYRANCGHIGGNFSCVEALLTLHHAVMTPADRFILSKGHSAGALYVTLWSMGKLTETELDTFCKENTALPGHPSGGAIPDLMFSTGSLGHGPSLAAGLALAARHQGSGRYIYCLCSDGEWQEGSCWEALIFAVHQRLNNLTILIDQNGLQGFGRTQDVISCSDLRARLISFGAHVVSVNGHDPLEIRRALKEKADGKPNILILKTIKGRGFYFEDRIESHYLPLTDAQFAAAREKLADTL